MGQCIYKELLKDYLLGTAGMLLTVGMLGTVGMFGKLGHSTFVEPPLTRTVLLLGLYQESPPSAASRHKNLSQFSS